MLARRNVVAILALAGACGGDPGLRYEIQLVPGARARNEASSVAVHLAGGSDALDFRFALPTPTPASPWRLDLDTHRWGGTSFSVVATALAGTSAVASGNADSRAFPASGPIVVDLADLPPDVGDAALPPDDLSTSDLSSPDLSCPQLVLQVLAEADTALVASNPGLNFGTNPIMNIGMRTGAGALDSFGIMRFDVSGLPVGAQLQSMQLTLSPATTSSQCSPSCGSCTSLDHAGGFAVKFLDSGWVESSATYTSMLSAVRSNITVNAAYSGTGPFVANIPASAYGDFALFSSGGKISFELDAFSMGQIVAASRDNASEACGSYAAPTLTIGYCQ